MRARQWLPIVFAVLSLGCDKATGSSGGKSEPKGSSTSSAAGGVPDACSLASDGDLAAAFGAPQGAGKSMQVSPDRSTCMYTTTGLITAVEIAGNYESTKSMIEGQGRKTTNVAGIGSAAFYDSAGQVVVKGKRVFVGVTKFGASVDALKGVAAKLLAKADS